MAYVGDERRGVDLLELFESRLHRSVHAATAGPDGAERVLEAPVDAVVCGPELSPAELQTVVFETADRRPGAPIFNLTGEPVAAPERLDVRQFDAGTPAKTAVERLAGTVVDGDAEPRTLGQYLAVDDAWRVVDWDPRLAAWTGVDPAEAIGESLWTVLPAGRDGELAVIYREAAAAGEPATTEVFHAPTERWFSLRVVPLRAGGLESYLHEITEYREQAFGAGGRLEQTLDRITDAFFALDTDERFVFLNSRAEFVLDVEEESVLGRRFPEVFPAATGTDFYEAFREALSSREPTSFREYYRPLERWFEVNAYPSEDGLSVFLRDVTEQVRLRHRLEQLHEVTRELVVAESDDAIAAETVRAAADVLGYDRVIVWRHDQQTQRLVPIAAGAGIEADPATDEDAAPGPVAPGTEPIWSVHEGGESQLTGYVPAAATAEYRPDAVASELLVPIGEYGVLAVYDEQRDAFDEPDTELFRVLAGAAASAFARARRERQLARRNERLDEFASVVSHDLRNPISVAAAHVELARDAEDPSQHLDTIDEALFRMEDLIDDLLARARGAASSPARSSRLRKPPETPGRASTPPRPASPSTTRVSTPIPTGSGSCSRTCFATPSNTSARTSRSGSAPARAGSTSPTTALASPPISARRSSSRASPTPSPAPGSGSRSSPTSSRDTAGRSRSATPRPAAPASRSPGSDRSLPPGKPPDGRPDDRAETGRS